MLKETSKEYFKKLKKYQKSAEAKLIVVEGERLILQLLDFKVNILELYIREDKIEKYSDIIAKINSVYTLSLNQSDALSETRSEQGIFALVEFSLTNLDIKSEQKNYFFFNNINDPGNLGTIFRTASAFGVDGLILDKGCCDLSNSKLIRASLGAVFVVPVLLVDNDWILNRKENIFITSCPTNEQDKRRPAVYNFQRRDTVGTGQCSNIYIIGSEAHGVSETILNIPHTKIWIPLQNSMQSLNVAVATSIIMYESVAANSVRHPFVPTASRR